MKIGVVFPQTEIGRDPAMIRDYAQAVEVMGYTHILAFHELSTTAAVMSELIANLKARGYRFVTLSEYMQLVGAKP